MKSLAAFAFVLVVVVVVACGAWPAHPDAADAAAGRMPAALADRLDFIAAHAPLEDLAVAVVKDGHPILLQAYGSATLGHLYDVGRILEGDSRSRFVAFGPQEQLAFIVGPPARFIPGLGAWHGLAVGLRQQRWVFQPQDYLIGHVLQMMISGRESWAMNSTPESALDRMGPLLDGRHGPGLVPGSYASQRRGRRTGALDDSPDSLVDIYPHAQLHIVLLTRSVGAAADVALRQLGDTLAANVLLKWPASEDLDDNAIAGVYVGKPVSGGSAAIEIVATPDGPHVRMPGYTDSKLLSAGSGLCEYFLAADSRMSFKFGMVNSLETPLTVSVDGQPQLRLHLVPPRR